MINEKNLKNALNYARAILRDTRGVKETSSRRVTIAYQLMLAVAVVEQLMELNKTLRKGVDNAARE